MNVKAFCCNPFQENCYVVWSDDCTKCIVIDPGLCCDEEWSRLQGFLVGHGLVPERILLTHCHSDHVMGTGYLTGNYPGLPICGSMEDQNHLPPVELQNRYFGVEAEVHWSPISKDLKEGDTFSFPEESNNAKSHPVQVLDCPGHSHHGLCYFFPDDKLLFTGDVLFYCSLGRSDFGPAMGCNGRLLLEGITQKLLTLPSDVKVYPGHGPATSIGNEATYNPYI